MDHMDESPGTARHIRICTRRDPVLSKLLQYVEWNWPSTCDKSLLTYSAKQSELSVFQGCVMWGSRVVIPPQGWSSQSVVWWSLIDRKISTTVPPLSAVACSSSCRSTPTLEMAFTTLGETPMDFAVPFQGKMILFVIDSLSKWIEAYPTDSSTSTKVIELSCTLFSQFGTPELLVTDNGSCL